MSSGREGLFANVTEIMVNGPDDVFVERKGRIEKVPSVVSEGEDDVRHLIERIVGPLGLRVDGSSPWVDARLPSGSRVQTGFLSTPFAGGGSGRLFRDAIETPAVWDAFQLVLAPVLEDQSGSRDEVLHGRGDEDLGRSGQ
jgi:type IV secretory pathway ATPase VirB11/archaellum biosynthesis ATPase